MHRVHPCTHASDRTPCTTLTTVARRVPAAAMVAARGCARVPACDGVYPHLSGVPLTLQC